MLSGVALPSKLCNVLACPWRNRPRLACGGTPLIRAGSLTAATLTVVLPNVMLLAPDASAKLSATAPLASLAGLYVIAPLFFR